MVRNRPDTRFCTSPKWIQYYNTLPIAIIEMRASKWLNKYIWNGSYTSFRLKLISDLFNILRIKYYCLFNLSSDLFSCVCFEIGQFEDFLNAFNYCCIHNCTVGLIRLLSFQIWKRKSPLASWNRNNPGSLWITYLYGFEYCSSCWCSKTRITTMTIYDM